MARQSTRYVTLGMTLLMACCRRCLKFSQAWDVGYGQTVCSLGHCRDDIANCVLPKMSEVWSGTRCWLWQGSLQFMSV